MLAVRSRKMQINEQYQKILDCLDESRTLAELMNELSIPADGFYGDKRFRNILNDMLVEKLIKKVKNTYTKIVSTDKPIVDVDEQFRTELEVALKIADKDKPWWISEIKKVRELPLPNLAQEIISFPVIPEPPQRGNYSTDFDKELEDYSEFSAETLKKLGEICLNQRTQLRAQDQLIRELHVYMANINRLLTSYVNPKPTR